MNWLYNRYLEARSIIAGSDLLYPIMINIIALVRPRQKDLMACKTHEIIIDGFPRSANTYFESFFEIAQGRPLLIGHHMHESYQIRIAEKYGIPAVILIRSPLDAVSSAILRDPRSDPNTLLRNYIRFYQNVHKHRKKAIIAPFETVVRDGNEVIKKINQIYNTSFLYLLEDQISNVSSYVEKKDQIAFATKDLRSTQIASPSKEKEREKAVIVGRILHDSHDLIVRANRIFQKIMSAEC